MAASAKENISRVLNQGNLKANAPSSIDNSNKTIWFISIILVFFRKVHECARVLKKSKKRSITKPILMVQIVIHQVLLDNHRR